MSSSVPPQGPSSDGPEYLSVDAAGGDGAAASGSGRRRGLLIGGAALAVAGLVGGGAWAAASFFGTGAQPSEALPATTLAYVSVDLDPDGEQKIEAVRMLRKFPEFRESVGLETGDDVRRLLFEETIGSGDCDVDFDDVEPWLGHRAAIAAVPGADGEPGPVAVLQVSDAAAAETGLEDLRACAGSGTGDGSGEDGLAWVVEGDWAVLAPTEEAARAAVDGAEQDGTLAEDADFGRWADEVGDAGIVSMYAAPALGDVLLEQVDAAARGDAAPGGPGAGLEGLEGLEGMGVDPGALAPGLAFGGFPGGEVPEETRQQLEAFDGAAGTIRIDDGALELDLASSTAGETVSRWAEAGAAEAVTSLPDDTTVALGAAMPEGWATDVVDGLEAAVGELARDFTGMPFDELLAEAERVSGLQLPEDVETLLGDSFALAVGDLDVEAAEQSQDGTGVPVGLRVLGDGPEIARIVDALDSAFGLGGVVGHEVDDDAAGIGPDPDYRSSLLEGGDLGSTERFEAVVPEGDDALMVAYVDLDAPWMAELAQSEGDEEAAANLEPLSAFGASAWVEDDVSWFSLRLTTD